MGVVDIYQNNVMNFNYVYFIIYQIYLNKAIKKLQG